MKKRWWWWWWGGAHAQVKDVLVMRCFVAANGHPRVTAVYLRPCPMSISCIIKISSCA